MECRPLAVDVSAMCQRVIEEVSAATESCRRIEFTASDLEQEAMLDEKLVQVILANLLSNALKYSGPDSTVEVAASRQGAEAVLEVRDTGIGIPLAEQADVFKSFQRGSNVTNIAGSGLGLTIVKRCVDLHKGAIALVSEAGQGTTVTVRLPAFGDRTGS
ncbi:MAG: sensor histidine kinase [Verrucomicrobiota bacterium]